MATEKEQLEDIVNRAEDLFQDMNTVRSLQDVTIRMVRLVAIFLDYAKMRVDILEQDDKEHSLGSKRKMDNVSDGPDVPKPKKQKTDK